MGVGCPVWVWLDERDGPFTETVSRNPATAKSVYTLIILATGPVAVSTADGNAGQPRWEALDVPSA